MASHPQHSMTVLALLAASAALLSSCIQGFSSAWMDATLRSYHWPFRRKLVVHIIRHFMPQIVFQPYCHDILPTTGSEVRSASLAAHLPLLSYVLTGEHCEDATLHQLRISPHSPRAPILLYFHGGGYHLPIAAAAQFEFAKTIAIEVGASSLFILEYTLTPHARYPSQLRQAVLALRYLLNEAHYKSCQIVLGGDSAGGNLVFALLAHMIQPHPKIAPLTEMVEKSLYAALCVSPWICQDYTSESFRVNDGTDVLRKKEITKFTELWAPEPEVWADMLQGDTSFWSRVPVANILITAGGIECLRDSIVELVKLVKAASGVGIQVDYVVGHGEIHGQPALDVALGLPRGQTMQAIAKWLGDLKVGTYGKDIDEQR